MPSTLKRKSKTTPEHSTNVELEGAGAAHDVSVKRLREKQDDKKTGKRTQVVDSIANSRRDDSYEYKASPVFDDGGRSDQSVAPRSRIGAVGRSGATLMKGQRGQVASMATVQDFEFRVKAGIIKDLSIDYSVSWYLEENHILALAQYEYARLTGRPLSDLHVLWVTDQSVVEQNPEALIEDNYRQLHTGINSALKGHPTFLGVSNYNHWAIIALLPSDNGEVIVVYMNSAYGKGAEDYFGCKPVGLGLCQNIVSQISSIPLNDDTPRTIVAEHIYLEPTQQIESNCGAVAGLNIAGIAAWYRIGKEVSLEEFLGGLKYNEVLSSQNRKRDFEALIKAHFNGIKTGSISIASHKHASSTRVLKAKMDNEYYEAIQRQILRGREEAELLHTYEQQNFMEGYDIELQEKMFLYYKTLQYDLHNRHHSKAKSYASSKPIASSAQKENGSPKKKKLKFDQEYRKPSSLDGYDESYMDDETDVEESEDKASATGDRQPDIEERHGPLADKPDSYPNDLVHGLLSAHCVDETDKYAGSSKVKAGDRVVFSEDNALQVRFMADKVDLNDYLSGWSAYDVIDDAQTGYLGIIYVNEHEKQAVLAHRSTNFALGLTTRNLAKQSGVQANIEGVLMGKIVTHQAYAYLATKKAVEFAKESGFILSITGHSLGAWLAELSIFYCSTDMSYKNVKGVTFDGPGSFEMMKQMSASEIRGASRSFKPKELDITSYFSAPNCVNSVNTHVGIVYRIFPEIDQRVPGWLEKVTGERTIAAAVSTLGNDLKYILPYFDIKTGVPHNSRLVKQWPSITHKEYGKKSGSLLSNYVNSLVKGGSFVEKMGGKLGIKIGSTVLAKLVGKETSTLESLVYFCRDFANDKIKRDQFWEVHKYLDRSRGYEETPQDEIGDFWRLSKAHYHTTKVNRHLRVETDYIDGWLKELKQSEGKLGMLTEELSRDIKPCLELYRYSAKQIKTITGVTISELRDKMRILLHKHGEEELGSFINAPAVPVVMNERYEIAPYFGITAIIKHKFVGREDELRDISNKLDNNKVVIIKGIPGVGKTLIASHYAKTIEEYTAIWFSANTKEALARSYHEFGETLHLHLEKQEEKMVMRIVNNRVSKTQQNILFVFDNVEGDYADVYAENLPKNVKLLITTRHDNSLSHLGPEIGLQPFSKETATSYLTNNGIKRSDANLLVNRIGTIPQHLSLVLSYLKSNRGKKAGDLVLGEKTIFEIVIDDLIKEGNSEEWTLLQYLAWLDPGFTPEDLLLAIVKNDGDKLSRIIEKLAKLSFVSVISKGETKGFTIHREVQDQSVRYAANHPELSNHVPQLLIEISAVLNEFLPVVTENPDEKWKLAKAYVATAEAIFEHSANRKMPLPENEESALLSVKLGKIYTEILVVDAKKGLACKEKALTAAQALYEENHTYMALFLDDVGLAYKGLGDAKKGLVYLERALTIREALYEGNHPDIAISLNNVGIAYEALGDIKKGLVYKKRALAIYQALYEGNHLDVAWSLNNVGTAYQLLGDAKKSLAYLEKALAMKEVLYEGNHPDVARSLNNVGAAYKGLGDVKRGLAYYERALDMYQALYEGDHPDMAMSLNNVGLAYKDLGDVKTCLTYLEKALTMYEALYKENHHEVATALNNIGDAYQALGNLNKGLEYFERALAIHQTIYEGNHPNVATSLNNVGLTYQDLGDVNKGLVYLERALAMQETLYEGDHPNVATSLNNVGIAYETLGDIKKGLVYQERALTMYQALYEGDHPDVATSLNNVGGAYKALGDIKEGLAYLERALAMREALYEGNHPEVAKSLNNVGLAYKDLEDIKKGLAYLERALAMNQALYEGNHPEVALSLNNVGSAYQDLGDVKQCLVYFERALAMEEALYEGKHLDVAKSLNNVGCAYQALGDIKQGLAYLERALAMQEALSEGNHPDVAKFLGNVGVAYGELGNIKKELVYQKRALAMYQALYKGNHPDVARSLNNVGATYKTLGDVKKGLAYLERALAMQETLYEGNHPSVATFLSNVGSAYETLGDVKKGLVYQKRALAIQEAFYEGNHPDVASSLNNVGTAYKTLGDVNKGLVYLERALAMREALYEGYHPDVATSLNNLGITYETLGDIEKGLVYQERALAMQEAFYEGNHPNVAASLNNVGCVYRDLEDVNKGLHYLERALAMREALYEGYHPDVAVSLNEVGIAYEALGDAKKGLVYQERALAMEQALYEGNHPKVATSLHNVAISYNNLGDIGKYNLYEKQSSSYDGFINKRGSITEEIINVKQKLQKNVLNKIQELAAKGKWGKKTRGKKSKGLTLGVLDYVGESDLKKQLRKLSNAKTVDIALALCFEAINIGIANSEEQNYNCAIEFAKAYPQIVSECVREHPEYFALECIAEACLEEEEYRMIVASYDSDVDEELKVEFKGKGALDYESKVYLEYYNTAIDKLLDARLVVVDSKVKRLDSWYVGKKLTSVSKLVGKVSNALSHSVVEFVLVPANLEDKHWLGLVFRKLDGVVEVVYMDSEQGSMVPQLKEGLERGLARNGYQAQFSEARLERQRYGNCGPEVIENFVYYLTSTRATQEAAIYVHSLLVENNLLDPKDYGRKLEENSRLIGFLSNAVPIEIMELPLLTNQGFDVEVVLEPSAIFAPAAFPSTPFGFRWTGLRMAGVEAFCKKLLYRQDLRKFGGMLGDYSIELPNGMTGFDVLLDNSKFNKLVMNKIHPDKNSFGADVGHEDTLFVMELRGKVAADLDVGKLLEDGLARVNPMLHKASVGFKALDVVVDSARLGFEPSMMQAKKLALDCANLHGLMVGANGYSLAIGVVETLYQLQMGEYKQAFDVVSSSLSAMALPVILSQVNRPYLGFVYGVWMAATTAYNALDNAYSFAQELASDDASLRSQIAYEELAEWLKCDVLNNMAYDAVEYEYYMK